MSSSAPPVLPISNSQPNPTVSSAASEPQVTAIRTLISNLSDSLRNGLSQRRPWTELTDRSAFSKPESFSEATLRIRKNFSYFRINYYAVVSLILAVSLLTNPFSLILLIGLLASWIFLYLFRPSDQPLIILGRTFSDFETLSLLAALTVFVVFLTNVGSVLVSALMLGVAVVCLHGSFRVPEDLFMDEQENSQTTGFLSFIRGVAAIAPAATAPPPSVRV
ncbi:putative prenylated rab acceptor PRA1 [Lupinus albus]|uniref:PRA1 family protein n=1 Tax=Lupinus albus TaxID=3870 RepID=A0A6A4PNK9_LUPAL|nr:putative prenylated rab acceptor PRA1 [Lupinus albus]